MSSKEVYRKNKQEVYVSPKFVYCSSVYKLWRYGACLIDEKYYTSDKPLNLQKVPTKLKKKDYYLRRTIELLGAPKNYLIENGYI